jgi:uncharacterized protein
MPSVLLALGILCIVAGIVGVILPAVPGTPLLVLGAILVAAADGFTRVGVLTLVLIGLLAAVGTAVDYAAGVMGARRGGASWWGVAGAVLGLVLGLPLGLPGLILGPAIGAIALEYFHNPDFRQALRAGGGVLLGFLVGTLVKLAMAGMIIGLLVFAYWW